MTGTITHKVNERNTLIWSNAASLVDYTLPSDDLVPSLDADVDGHLAAARSRELVSANLGGLGAVLRSRFATVESAAPLPRRRLGSMPGSPSASRLRERSGVVVSIPKMAGLPLVPSSMSSADYKLKKTSYSFSAARDLSPSQDGQLNDRYSARFGVSHQVNDLTDAWGSPPPTPTRFQMRSADASAFTISPSLSYRLSQDWIPVNLLPLHRDRGRDRDGALQRGHLEPFLRDISPALK